MGLGSAWYLSQKGYRVTVLEKNAQVAMVASSVNGAMICPSMCNSWASLKLLSEVGEIIAKKDLGHTVLKTWKCSPLKIFRENHFYKDS